MIKPSNCEERFYIVLITCDSMKLNTGMVIIVKKLDVRILDTYKLYKKGTSYGIDGDLIILSGINGSGKSQLLQIIAKNSKESISRNVVQIQNNGESENIEDILLLSFRDNINLGKDFGQFSVTYKKNYATNAWEYYKNNIKHLDNNQFANDKRSRRYREGTLIFDTNGIKNPSWRSINRLVELIKTNYSNEKAFNLEQTDIERILPADFIWRNDNDIIAQVGNLFYIACCDRVNKQIDCSTSTAIFNNEEWLKTAPWTILNQLFEELSFKYRFKTDYVFTTPNMEENPKLRDNFGIRNLMDLSDGEKAILKLALISLDEEISKDIKLVLFDEYDAPLNPSLTEAFYHVIEKFYVEKGIQVVITTHSPATISLAPEYAQFYEIFPQGDSSPKIVKVEQFDYSELRTANKQFYDKIKNQSNRIAELEKLTQTAGRMLFVEDKYDQIYKIAYLKVKGIEGITEENFEAKFSEHCDFTLHGNFSCGGLYNRLISSNTTNDQDSIIVCLFDFDAEGYRKFEELAKKKDNQTKLFPTKEGTTRDGLCLKHHQSNRYALMIPIPERLDDYVSEETSSDCFIEIETLLSEEYLKSNAKAEQRSKVLKFYKMRDKHKNDFWKDLFTVDKEHFKDFEPLFSRVEKIFTDAGNNTN